ncbi:DUF6301 family protein [Paenarthrobacter sp. RAF9]
MEPAELCDIMDFWIAAPWPLTEDETHQRAVERFGWTIEVENGRQYLMNTASNFTIPDVMTVPIKDRMMELSLQTSDTTREITPQRTELLSDAFTLMVREGEARWGKPTLRDYENGPRARWNVNGGARVSFHFFPRGLLARFETPQGAEVERKLGDR